jgi:hypothetical protein
LIELFSYIQPSDINLKTYSFRIHELFIRTCIEVEANFRAILVTNGYKKISGSKANNLSVEDFYKVNTSHFLSDYRVKFPYWSDNLLDAIRQPFKAWGSPANPSQPHVLPWYQDYNRAKHDRVNNLHLANFENLIDAFSGLVALMTAQYMFEDFSLNPQALTDEGARDGFETAIGDYFRVTLPSHIPDQDRYDFDWQILSRSSSPFQKYNYDI